MPSLLVFTPHPDDESFAFAGLIATAARAGWRVAIHCASAGENGKRHDGGPIEGLAEAREAELADSCRLLGAEPPVSWRLPDGGLRERAADLIERTSDALRHVQPDLVATLGADGAYGHPDHIALHHAVEAVFATAGERSALLFPAFPKGLFLPQYEKCRHMMGTPPEPPPGSIGVATWDWELDITNLRDLKLSAIGAHRSQLPGADPRALFPPGVVEALLDTERFTVAGSLTQSGRALLESKAREITPRSH